MFYVRKQVGRGGVAWASLSNNNLFVKFELYFPLKMQLVAYHMYLIAQMMDQLFI